ncbi:MAG: sodium:solute symporter family protein [Propionibacteriaceae bacterium]|nr:sodium:solute symporter family protein [Propionibacteriaceae bacterium]
MTAIQIRPEFLWFVGAYFLVMIGIGVWASRRVKNADDYNLAGRSLGPVVLAGTLMATSVGSGTVTGGGNSLAYNYGLWAGVAWIIPYIVIFPVYMWINGKIRKVGAYTTSEILGRKYGPLAKIMGFVVTCFAFVGIVSYQYRGLANVLAVTTGIDSDTGLIIGVAVIVIIALLGGLFSVAYTDAFGAFLILIMCLIAIPVAISAGGGWDAIVSSPSITPEKLSLSGGREWYQWLSGYLPLIILLLGDQNFYQRFAAAKSDQAAKIGAFGWMALACLAIPGVGVMAFVGLAMFGDNIEASQAFMAATTLLPTAVGGLLLAAATAFIVTTGTSYLLSSSTNIIYDISATYIKKDMSEKTKLWASRLCIPILGVLAYIVLKFFPDVLAVQNWSYTMIGAGLTPAIIGALVWPMTTKVAGIASIIVGAGTTLWWEIIAGSKLVFAGGVTGIGSALVAFPLAILTLVVVTLLTGKKSATPAIV